MSYLKLILKFKIYFIINFLIFFQSNADNHNIYETLEIIKNDLKTLEKAVYSNSSEFNNTNSSFSSIDYNTEDVITRHLLKYSMIYLKNLQLKKNLLIFILIYIN